MATGALQGPPSYFCVTPSRRTGRVDEGVTCAPRPSRKLRSTPSRPPAEPAPARAPSAPRSGFAPLARPQAPSPRWLAAGGPAPPPSVCGASWALPVPPRGPLGSRLRDGRGRSLGARRPPLSTTPAAGDSPTGRRACPPPCASSCPPVGRLWTVDPAPSGARRPRRRATRRPGSRGLQGWAGQLRRQIPPRGSPRAHRPPRPRLRPGATVSARAADAVRLGGGRGLHRFAVAARRRVPPRKPPWALGCRGGTMAAWPPR